jgi:hypothetical protein
MVEQLAFDRLEVIFQPMNERMHEVEIHHVNASNKLNIFSSLNTLFNNGQEGELKSKVMSELQTTGIQNAHFDIVNRKKDGAMYRIQRFCVQVPMGDEGLILFEIRNWGEKGSIQFGYEEPKDRKFSMDNISDSLNKIVTAVRTVFGEPLQQEMPEFTIHPPVTDPKNVFDIELAQPVQA